MLPTCSALHSPGSQWAARELLVPCCAGRAGLDAEVARLHEVVAGPHLCHMFISAQCWGGAGGEAPKRSLWNLLYQDCVKNPYVWLFAIAYFFVYVVRQGVTSWFIFYLQARALHPALRYFQYMLEACV